MSGTALQLAEYLSARIRWPRDTVPRYLPRYDADPWGAHPTADQLAAELIAEAEFRALALGTWLGTDQGQLIAEAIELVSPPFLRHDEQLLEQALAVAVQMQADGKRQQAGALALAAVLIAALIALAFGSGE